MCIRDRSCIPKQRPPAHASPAAPASEDLAPAAARRARAARRAGGGAAQRAHEPRAGARHATRGPPEDGGARTRRQMADGAGAIEAVLVAMREHTAPVAIGPVYGQARACVQAAPGVRGAKPQEHLV